MKHKIRKTVYPILCRFRKKVSFDLFGWTACWSKSFKADLSSSICIKVLLLKRTSQQGEIELPPESTKLKSESDFWRYFRISCHARWEIKRETLIYSHIFTFFWFLLCGIIWCRGPVTQNGFTLFIVLCLVSTVSMTVSGLCVHTVPTAQNHKNEWCQKVGIKKKDDNNNYSVIFSVLFIRK